MNLKPKKYDQLIIEEDSNRARRSSMSKTSEKQVPKVSVNDI